MAFPTISYIPAPTIRDILKGAIAAKIQGGTPDTLNVALYGDSATFTVADASTAYTATGEVTGTNWSAKGVALTGVTMATTGSGVNTGIMLDDTGNVSVASTTISTAVKGCLVFDDTIAAGTADCGLAVIYFGNASGYTTNNGTFGITWDNTNGIWKITLSNPS